MKESAMHDANKVANRLLEMATAEGKSFTPMQILKLVYIAHGWTLGVYGTPLIQDKVEAWKYGPVIPRIYHEIKDFKNNPVTSLLRERLNSEEFSEKENDAISFTYKIYGSKNAHELSSLTHQTGTPWDLTYTNSSWGAIIPNDLIKNHYELLFKNRVAPHA
jgi:uncharacterized phage-associated protein